jgi:hypothetical protein
MKISVVLFLLCIFQIVLCGVSRVCPPSCLLLLSKKEGDSPSEQVQQDIERTCTVKCTPDVASCTCTKKYFTLNYLLEKDAYKTYCQKGKKCDCTKVRDLAVAAGDARVVESVSTVTNTCNSQTFPNCKKETYWVWANGIKFTKKELKQMGYNVNGIDDDDEDN